MASLSVSHSAGEGRNAVLRLIKLLRPCWAINQLRVRNKLDYRIVAVFSCATHELGAGEIRKEKQKAEVWGLFGRRSPSWAEQSKLLLSSSCSGTSSLLPSLITTSLRNLETSRYKVGLDTRNLENHSSRAGDEHGRDWQSRKQESWTT